jgi:heme iron utilization protein
MDMKDRALDPGLERQVVAHMNADHADAVLLYVTALAALPQATRAELVAIDLQAMTLRTDLPAPNGKLRIALEPPPDGPTQIRAALVAMAKRARNIAIGCVDS